MKTQPVKILCLICIINIAWYVVPEGVYSLSQGVIELSGSTEVDNWIMKSSEMESTGTFSLKNGKLAVVSPFHFSMYVKSLKSSNPIRDAAIYKYLRSYPNEKIYFRHIRTEIRQEATGKHLLKITGNINIAGITQITVLNLRSTTYTHQIKMSGTTVLKMSKFQVFPKNVPGSSTYDDNVRVSLDLVFSDAN